MSEMILMLYGLAFTTSLAYLSSKYWVRVLGTVSGVSLLCLAHCDLLSLLLYAGLCWLFHWLNTRLSGGASC